MPDKWDKLAEHQKGGRRLILLDYEGALVPSGPHVKSADADPELMDLLKPLSAHPLNHVYIISGKRKEFLEQLFRGMEIRLVAEYGAWMGGGGLPWKSMQKPDATWKARIFPILETLAKDVRDFAREEREFSIACHFHECEPNTTTRAARYFEAALEISAPGSYVRILAGRHTVELRCLDLDVGLAAYDCRDWLAPVFTVAVGGEFVGLDLFPVLPPGACAFGVAWESPPPYAYRNLKDCFEARDLLQGLLPP